MAGKKERKMEREREKRKDYVITFICDFAKSQVAVNQLTISRFAVQSKYGPDF